MMDGMGTHLRSRPQALLDQPSPRCPEVTFCSGAGRAGAVAGEVSA